ncbi:hypothetical protein H8356DRAFT_1631000 [Neocallimastix lanati (nom. inval.)]|nr:hypothetical protein H8356DRAFT_1631000 [Neocallimastix sp. JGI-2020a]
MIVNHKNSNKDISRNNGLKVKRFLWFSQTNSIKICSFLFMVIVIGFTVVTGMMVYESEKELFMMIEELGIPFIMNGCIIGAMILFFYGLRKDKMLHITDYKTSLCYYVSIYLFYWLVWIYGEVAYKFIYDEQENDTSQVFFNTFKEKYPELSDDDEIKKLMKTKSMITMSASSLAIIFIIYYYLLIKTYVEQLENESLLYYYDESIDAEEEKRKLLSSIESIENGEAEQEEEDEEEEEIVIIS